MSVDFKAGVLTPNVCDDCLVAPLLCLFFVDRKNIGVIGIADRACGLCPVGDGYADANDIKVVHLSTFF